MDNAQLTANKMASVLNGMEKKAIESNEGIKQYTSFYNFFVLMALLILIGEIFIPETKRKKAS